MFRKYKDVFIFCPACCQSGGDAPYRVQYLAQSGLEIGPIAPCVQWQPSRERNTASSSLACRARSLAGVTAVVVSVLTLSILALAGLYLIALGAVSLASPRLARAFLSAFASSPAKHFIELAIRLTVGAACIAAAPRLPWPRPFEVLGWLLVATTAALLLVPWRAHQRFAQISVSRAAGYLALVGIASLLAGLAVLASVWSAAPLDQ